MTIDPTNRPSEMQPPEGRGVDQGAVAHVDERLTPEAAIPVDLTTMLKPGQTTAPVSEREGPLLAPTFAAASRSYVGVSVSAKGKRGPMSARATVAMVDPPPTLAAPEVTYTESAISVSWPPIGGATPAPAAPGTSVLPSTPIGTRGADRRLQRVRCLRRDAPGADAADQGADRGADLL